MTFAQKLKELREAAPLTREQLSEASGLSRGVIRDYEQGKRKPTLESAVRIARALGVSVEVFAESFTGAEGQQRSAEARGRPPRSSAEQPAPKRPRGRPKKGG